VAIARRSPCYMAVAGLDPIVPHALCSRRIRRMVAIASAARRAAR
jgi:hypothetical protein